MSHNAVSLTCFNVAASFNWRDALNLESLLTEEEIILRDTIRQYCDEKLMPRILESNRHEGIHISLKKNCVTFLTQPVYLFMNVNNYNLY